ncbi:MAG TPA: CBS domain-containing protein [Polyangiales bacterium]|nr:CBS domain-containing protein [Polyangiales bacterium]
MSRAIDIMTQTPATLPVNATVGDAVQALQMLDVRHLPVINAQREVVGMFSDRDLRALSTPRIANEQWIGEYKVALQTKVRDVMTQDVITIEEECEVTEIIELMLEHKVGALPVVDAEGALSGIVSYIDVLRALYELEARAAE